LCLGLMSGGRQLPPFPNVIDDGQFVETLTTGTQPDISHGINRNIFYIIG
jgi:hypothetical protein